MSKTVAFFGFVISLVALSSCSSPRTNSPERPSSAPSAAGPITQKLARVGIAGCHRVRAYTINIGDEYPAPNQAGVIEGRLNPKRSPKGGVELSADQVDHFLRAVATDEHPGPHALCFYPHHALIFFDASDRIIGHYTICFKCFGYQSSLGRFVSEPDYEALHRLVTALSLPKP